MTGRIGVAVESKRFSSVINVAPPTLTKPKIMVEFPSMDDDAIYIDEENNIIEEGDNVNTKLEDDNEMLTVKEVEIDEEEVKITKEVKGKGPIKNTRKLLFSTIEKKKYHYE